LAREREHGSLQKEESSRTKDAGGLELASLEEKGPASREKLKLSSETEGARAEQR
jgi:hypothetical protein